MQRATQSQNGAIAPMPDLAPPHWRSSCANVECSMHQLSPYIGKIKSSIAGELVECYSKPNDLIIDPFAGAGTIPLEAALRGRRVFGSDISSYARILSNAKLFPPASLAAALASADEALLEAERLPKVDLRSVPVWVRKFFHPETLRAALAFTEVIRRSNNDFLMACFLGILHHQRPGFLSYPSSHLVPYLRDKKYPKDTFPEMYEFRALRPRLIAKIERSFKRYTPQPRRESIFKQSSVENLLFPEKFDAIITSPPYMNALDYSRDNRLRLWFIDFCVTAPGNSDLTRRRKAFVDAITSIGEKLEIGLKRNGFCIFVVGEEFNRSYEAHPSQTVVSIFREQAPSVALHKIIVDEIPDVRRTRKECRGVKNEHILIFQKN